MLSKLLHTTVMIELEEMSSKELLVDVTYYYEPEEYESGYKVWNAIVEITDIKLFGNSIWGLIDDYQYRVIEESILNLHQGE